ncbi:unnamed protein product [Spirodela intermedia]|uniref:Uncharacterized protein n=1 Tax=Spirodela intermedia TaxID=51605 RepID=A0A7I8IG93_SPIIN|nr:unnamed protein product [Spirodela intermedia]CAA6656889.1 unnamed protein product [Spirodela intermedia]
MHGFFGGKVSCHHLFLLHVQQLVSPGGEGLRGAELVEAADAEAAGDRRRVFHQRLDPRDVGLVNDGRERGFSQFVELVAMDAPVELAVRGGPAGERRRRRRRRGHARQAADRSAVAEALAPFGERGRPGIHHGGGGGGAAREWSRPKEEEGGEALRERLEMGGSATGGGGGGGLPQREPLEVREQRRRVVLLGQGALPAGWRRKPRHLLDDLLLVAFEAQQFHVDLRLPGIQARLQPAAGELPRGRQHPSALEPGAAMSRGGSPGEPAPQCAAAGDRSSSGLWAKKQTLRVQPVSSLQRRVRYCPGWSQHSNTPWAYSQWYLRGSRRRAFSPGWTKGHSGFTLKEYMRNSSVP